MDSHLAETAICLSSGYAGKSWSGMQSSSGRVISIGNSWRIEIDERSTGMLVTNGIFAFPTIQSSPLSIFISSVPFLMNGSLVFSGLTVVHHPRSALPDPGKRKFLVGRYGQAYQVYCKQTGDITVIRQLVGLGKWKAAHKHTYRLHMKAKLFCRRCSVS